MDQIFHFEAWTMKCIVSGALRKRTGYNESVVHPHLSLTDEDRRKCRHFNLRNLATDLFCFPIRTEGSSVGTNLVDLNIFATAHRFIDQVSSKMVGIVVFKESVDLIDELLQRTDRFII